MIDDSIKIVSYDTYQGLSIVEQAALDFAVMKQTFVLLLISPIHLTPAD
jgi:hypothetical protein